MVREGGLEPVPRSTPHPAPSGHILPTASSSRCDTSSRSSSNRSAYTSSVIATDTPASSGSPPHPRLPTANDAAVCRRSCGVICGMSALFTPAATPARVRRLRQMPTVCLREHQIGRRLVCTHLDHPGHQKRRHRHSPLAMRLRGQTTISPSTSTSFSSTTSRRRNAFTLAHAYRSPRPTARPCTRARARTPSAPGLHLCREPVRCRGSDRPSARSPCAATPFRRQGSPPKAIAYHVGEDAVQYLARIQHTCRRRARWARRRASRHLRQLRSAMPAPAPAGSTRSAHHATAASTGAAMPSRSVSATTVSASCGAQSTSPPARQPSPCHASDQPRCRRSGRRCSQPPGLSDLFRIRGSRRLFSRRLLR